MTARITYLIVVVLLITGCKYTFTEESKIEEGIISRTALGISSAEARVIANEYFSGESFWGHGLAEQTENGWIAGAWFPDPAKRNGAGPYYFIYKIGSHPSPYVVLPTYVFAYWFFDDGDRLVQVSVKKEIDAI